MYIFFLPVSFLLGSIPFGFLAAKLKGIDIRQKGSGNIGATNVTRLLGWKIGLPVLLLDILKGAVFPLTIRLLYGESQELLSLFCGVAAVLGHMFSPFLKLKGGKGVATSFGVFAVLAPGPTLITLIVFLSLKKIFGFVSIGSIGGAVTLPISYYLLSLIDGRNFNTPIFWAIVSISLTILVLHRTNLIRLIKGQEFASDKEKYKAQE
ncbi:acyl-phosphate glycerol 3-phosphate acyltransferase [Leptospira licerasiae serovar Varillal str. VAR 010]|uniref:Glycerol-3-phosphate acyltransferase n=1 Tax=Leptospira licerasiae str. MMD4847 TaxID=1049971 RepID=A0ABN0H917_9LEPT|nr:acyl-phosphate glycerol 3-phosphate acyltransferase [Leptospira licerasiae serovar Varillal str. VAR 010]EJZ42082.1 acyl-phosphate glycerol 3-phosphate acyltransferase [Leptospira licerasiae str. MMD4847]TGM95010.1 glycerol-3-phosphate 1-O-acyltransferase [Leptospira licerasiae]